MLEKEILLKDYIKNLKKEDLSNVISKTLMITTHIHASSLVSITIRYSKEHDFYTLSVYDSLVSVPVKFYDSFNSFQRALNNVYKKEMIGNWEELKIFSILDTKE